MSILTGLQAVRALSECRPGGSVRAIYWSKTGAFFEVPTNLEARAFLDGVPAGARGLELVLGSSGGFRPIKSGRFAARPESISIDAVLVCCHGGPGEDGSLQAALDLAGIAYSGPSASSAALGMDKYASGAVLEAAGVPVLARLVLREGTPVPDFSPPYIVKPRFGGSSIGIEIVSDYETALALLRSSVHLRRGGVLEPYRSDLSDLQVAVRTWPEVQLSAIERPIRKSEQAGILNYADKYVGGAGMDAAPRELPADISPELSEQLRYCALVATGALGVRGVGRIDFLSDGKELFVNEINTIPGSLSRHLFVEPRLAFAQLLDDLLAEAVGHPTTQFSSAGSDGLVLRDAQAIAAKLAPPETR